jgi:hypothetical protein
MFILRNQLVANICATIRFRNFFKKNVEKLDVATEPGIKKPFIAERLYLFIAGWVIIN